MLTSLKAPFAAILLSSVALVPATTVAFVATADVAIAKSDNAGGGGKGNSGGKSGNAKSSGSKGGSSAKATTSGSKGGGKSGGGASASRGHGGLDDLFNKITGKGKTKSANAKRSSTSSSAKLAGAAPKQRPEKGDMHPSSLGKMNGALNANVNAIIAHVKNGNTNGPIGGMAALAIAGYAAESAAETLALAEDFAALDQALIDAGFVDDEGAPNLQAYLDSLEDVEGQGEITAIEAAIAGEEGAPTIEEALSGEINMVQDFASVEDYLAYRDGTAGEPPIESVELGIAATDGQARPGDEDLEFANERIGDRTEAEDYMLSIWNKGDGAEFTDDGEERVRTDAEIALLDALYDRLEADGEVLSTAIEEYADLPEAPMEDEPVVEDDVAECTSGDPDCVVAGEEVAAVE
jgi:hypothetical protein